MSTPHFGQLTPWFVLDKYDTETKWQLWVPHYRDTRTLTFQCHVDDLTVEAPETPLNPWNLQTGWEQIDQTRRHRLWYCSSHYIDREESVPLSGVYIEVWQYESRWYT